MRKIILVLGFILSLASLNAVEIVNNTHHMLEIGNFCYRSLDLLCPYSFGPGDKVKHSVSSFMGHVEGYKEIYLLNDLKENTVITFIEENELITVQRLDKVLPEPDQEFTGFLK